MVSNARGCSEPPKPGCEGAITRARSASRSSTGAAPSRPMPGCRNNSGRPRPRSISSTRMPLTVIKDGGSCADADIGEPLQEDGYLLPSPCHIVGNSQAPTKFRAPLTNGVAVPETSRSHCEIRKNVAYANGDGVHVL